MLSDSFSRDIFHLGSLPHKNTISIHYKTTCRVKVEVEDEQNDLSAVRVGTERCFLKFMPDHYSTLHTNTTFHMETKKQKTR